MANRIIEVRVDDKIASVVGDPLYVCGNSDYIVKFTFDDEWADHVMKTARFIKSNKEYFDVVFNGNECPMPIIDNTPYVRIGVFAGNLCTTTAAIVNAQRSILCGSGVPAEPDPDVYAQILERIDGLGVPDLNRRVDTLLSNAVIAQRVRGDVLHIEDAASWPVEKLVINIAPKQEGSGDPSPSNVRQIIPRDKIQLVQNWSNLLSPKPHKIGIASNAIGYYEACTSFEASVKPGMRLIARRSGTSTGNRFGVAFTTDRFNIGDAIERPSDMPAKVYGTPVQNVEKIEFTVPDGYNWLYLYVDNAGVYPSVESYCVTDAAEAEFVPNTGKSVEVSLGATVYGGEYDWKTGKLSVKSAAVKISDLSWGYVSSVNYFMATMPTDAKTSSDDYICEIFKTIGYANDTTMMDAATGVLARASEKWLAKDTRYTTVDAFVSANGNHNISYELTTPIEIQLTPQQMPELLKGVNNVWCDTGETEMVYIADNQLYIDQKIGESTAALNALMEGIDNV